MQETQNEQQQQPGQVFGPAPTPTQVAPAVIAPTPVPEAPAPIPQPDLPFTAQQPLESVPVHDSGSQDGLLRWIASEYIGHHKSRSWFMGYAAAATIVIVIVVAITRDIMSLVALIVGAIVLGMYAARPPRDVEYILGSNGFAIGEKQFSYAQFQSYSVVDEGKLASVIFAPLKRFAPYTTLYFNHDQADAIMDILDQVLPYKEFQHDPIDQLLQRIRF